MYLAVIFLILFIISVALALLLKYRFEQTLAITCFGTIFLFYLLGLAGIMSAGIYVVIAACVIALGLCAWGIVKGSVNKDFLLGRIFTPGFVVFCVFYIFICYVHTGRILSFWDEFSHWGLVVKNMYVFDAFGNHPDATTLFRGYPPSTALFQYFWMQFNEFYEPDLYRAFGVLSFSFVLPVFKNVNWNNFRVTPFIALFIGMIPMYLYYDYYREIYVDGILGILFAYILFTYFTEKKFDASFCINLALASFVLTLVKASGFGLALTAGLIIILDYAVMARKSVKEKRLAKIDEDIAGISNVSEEKQTIKSRTKIFFTSKAFYIPAIVIVSSVIANQSWSIYRQFTNTGFAWGGISDLTIPAVMELLAGRADPAYYAIIERYITAFFSYIIYVGETGYTYLQWTLIFSLVLFIWLRKVDHPLRSRLINCAAGMFIGWVIYNLTLILLYVFTFPTDVASILASYSRYINTYFTAAICLFSILYIYYVNENKKLNKRMKFIRMVVFFVVAAFTFYFWPVVNLLKSPEPGVRDNVTVYRLSSLSLDYRTDRVHYIHIGSSGFEHFIAYYELTPVKGAEWLHWSIGSIRSDDDVWTTYITQDEWADMLRDGYTYVYLERIDELFIEEFGGVFEDTSQIRNRSLFKVTERDGRIVLVYVELEA
ncbi:MAG: hypothetical protein FWE83_00285 [Oscillospiraceae bacterium]|nr:hypothetical protein [Oscillospiraceae bacterium]